MTPELGQVQVSRRQLLAGALAVGASATVLRLSPAIAGTPSPPGFPTWIELYRQAFKNWDGEIAIDDLWTCAPRTPDDVVAIANWAVGHGYRLRARGYMHTWSPLTVTPGSGNQKIVLVDTTRHLTAMRLVASSPPAVQVQTGAAMEALLGFLEQAGYGFTAVPSTGGITIGGVLAVDGHGASVPAVGEARPAGHGYGSLSNRVVSLTAVVWDDTRRRFALRAFDRSDEACSALLVHLGRAFLTEVTLQVGADTSLRCQSHIDIPAAQLFAPPNVAGAQSFTRFLDATGRVEAIWFAFTDRPWLKVWSVSPTQPLGSRPVSAPYNYPFSHHIPDQVAQLARQVIDGNPELTPAMGQAEYAAIAAGLAATASADLWGHSKNLLLYVRNRTMPAETSSYAIHTRRRDVQHVVSDFAAHYQTMLDRYRAQGHYPINIGVEIRATGLDIPADLDAHRARPPSLSALAPYAEHPDWDVAVWISTLTMPGTPGAAAFFRELETWMFHNYNGARAAARPEWSKGWGYTDRGAWTDTTFLATTLPGLYGADARMAGWNRTVRTLDDLDPHRVFTNDLLDTFLR